MKETWQEKLEDKASLPKALKLRKGFPCYNVVHKIAAEAGDNFVLVNPSVVVSTFFDMSTNALLQHGGIHRQIHRRRYYGLF